ncbi:MULTISPECIES: class I SAM-dependent methyltransferase [Streptosporangium]|uniref:Class I SAM-dependent methyltransferase n=1 Tax=Streptosporangium jomthongense TaxID=1193683 RepID=A0ABV8FFR3_9ACTN
MTTIPAGDFDYERHGHGYAGQRRTDPRIAAHVHAALGQARTVVNVGAGAGSYEPPDRHVVAVEPSAMMRAQRPRHLAPAVNAAAERLPFDDGAFDAAMATVTVHQWSDLGQGLRELRRVSRGPVVVLTFDRDLLGLYWLAEYAPEIIAVEHRRYPPIDLIASHIGSRAEVLPVAIPFDCVDGFAEAYYARPERFLDAEVRASQSAWGFVDDAVQARTVDRLRRDLESGAWDERFGHLREQPEFLGSLKLVVGRP